MATGGPASAPVHASHSSVQMPSVALIAPIGMSRAQGPRIRVQGLEFLVFGFGFGILDSQGAGCGV